jgi:cell wall-associated NlpC family hydrolase
VQYVRRRGTTVRVLASAAVVSLALSVVTLAPSATASGTGPSISHTRTLVIRLSKRLVSEEELSGRLDQEFETDRSRLQTIDAAIHNDQSEVVIKQSQFDATSKVLVRALVRSYVIGAADNSGIPLLNTNTTTSDAQQVYENEVLGNISAMVHKLTREKRYLAHDLLERAHQQSLASAEIHQIHDVVVKNNYDEAQTQDTLNQIKGNLEREIVAYEINVAVKDEEDGDSRGVTDAIQAASEFGQAAANQVIAAVDRVTPPTGVIGTAAGTKQGNEAVAAAASQIGVPYVWGGESPGQGFDCSGLTQWSWGQAGVDIPRTADEQYYAIPHVSLSHLRPGDLLFYYNLDGDDTIDHVVMYVGSGPYGTNTIIAAAYTGTDIGYEPLFTNGLIGAGRP